MIEKIKKRWEAYKKKETVWGHISNVIFILFVIAMLIPSTRKVLSATLIKLTLFDRGAIDPIPNPVKLNDNDKEFNIYGPDKVIPFKVFDDEVVVINYWATWCPPCIAEMPNFQELYSDYGNKVAFLFLTTDPHDKVDAFMKKNGYNLPAYNYDRLPPPFDHTSIPTTFVLNRKGEIVFSRVGAYKWNGKSFRAFLDRLIGDE